MLLNFFKSFLDMGLGYAVDIKTVFFMKRLWLFRKAGKNPKILRCLLLKLLERVFHG